MKKVLFISLVMLMIMTADCTVAHASAVLSFFNSSVKLKGPSMNSFKGNVSLDSKGIMIKAGDGQHDEGMLRLVSEKLDNDSFLIDYRLFRNCDVKVSYLDNKEKLVTSFSPFSLENRKKNDNFDVSMEIKNYEKFIDKQKYKTESDIQGYIKSQCENRKSKIAEYKTEFSNMVLNYRKSSRDLEDISASLRKSENEMETIKTSIQETQSQIKDINYLKDSYQMQLKSITSLTTGATKLITNEEGKQDSLLKKQNELEDQIKIVIDEAKEKEKFLNKLKENYSKTMENSKDVENKIINTQKSISEYDNNLSNSRSEQLRVDFDLKNASSQKESIDKSLKEIEDRNKVLNVKNEGIDYNIKQLVKEKEKESKNIISGKEELKKMEEQINELIKKKSRMEETLKFKYDQIKVIEENLTNKKLEAEHILNETKLLNDKKERLEGMDKTEVVTKIENLKAKMESYEKTNTNLETERKKLSDILNESNNQKELINKKLDENKNEIEKIQNELLEKTKTRNDLNRTKNNMLNEIRKNQFKIKNLRMENTNYKMEVDNVNKSLSSTDDNIKTFEDMLKELNVKKEPIEKKYNSLNEKKEFLEKDTKDQNKKIKERAEKLKSEVPSATIMVDLAQDEVFNNATTETGEKEKWRTLIERIIS